VHRLPPSFTEKGVVVGRFTKVVFHDAALREMARVRPTSIDALLSVKGIGPRKADDLGDIFLAAIRDHQPRSG